MSKAEFTMLAHKYEGKSIGGWFASEKLDGQRCIYDGGVTRGMKKNEVIWANTAKDGRYVNTQYATGLWSRYGHPIMAPDDFLDQLPKIPLDGELYSRRINRQQVFSIIKDQVPSKDWSFIEYHVFDMVPLDFWLMDRIIKNTGFQKSLKGCFQWVMNRGYNWEYLPKPMTQFITTVELMKQKLVENNVLKVHPQTRLDSNDTVAKQQILDIAGPILEAGGEGLILKNPFCYWQGVRTHDMVKYKPTDDAEGVVVDYVTGRETDKGSKLLGLMGALVIRLDNGQIMELSGFTDAEREFKTTEMAAWAKENPGEPVEGWIEAKFFPRGTRVNFRYRGLSDKGIPQEARYNRIRNDD